METSTIETLGYAFDSVSRSQPLVHNITNYVTVNDCANALLAIGASPIMSDEPLDVVDITGICGGLVINIGTLNTRTIEGMFAAGRRSSELGHPIVLDPVGAGASRLRTDTASSLLDELRVSVIRGNMSEIKALAEGASTTRGVDVCPADAVTRENLIESASFARQFARRADAVVAITGAIDIIADATRSYAVFNGSPLQGRITGTGCMLSSLCGAFATAYPDDVTVAMLSAVCTMGLAGEHAAARMEPIDGTGSYRTYLIDALSTMTADALVEGAKVEEV